MSYEQGGTVSPMVFLLACLLIAAALGIWTLIKFLQRPKCANCGVRLADWNPKTGYSTLKVINPEQALLLPLCNPCYFKMTTPMRAPRWTHKKK